MRSIHDVRLDVKENGESLARRITIRLCYPSISLDAMEKIIPADDLNEQETGRLEQQHKLRGALPDERCVHTILVVHSGCTHIVDHQHESKGTGKYYAMNHNR